MDVATYATNSVLEIFDVNANNLLSAAITPTYGATSKPGTYVNFQVNSLNGIGGWRMLAPAGGAIEGNTSIDNVTVNVKNASSVPGPLPLFGAVAAYGYSRTLRKHIKGGKRPLTRVID